MEFKNTINNADTAASRIGARIRKIREERDLSQTELGDMVSVDKPKGKGSGHHIGRVMTRASGYFDVRTSEGGLINASYKYCRLLQKKDGYSYRYAAIPLGD